MPLADRLGWVSTSQTQQVLAAVQKLRRDGADVIDLGAGEPDFVTPDHICSAAVEAIHRGHTKYTAGSGIMELREAIAEHYCERTGVTYAKESVLVTSGGKQGLFNVALALFGPGDEVVTHVPGWPSICEQVRLTGADSVRVRASAENGFRLSARTIIDAISNRTRAVIINSPGNPTGALIEEEELAQLISAIEGLDIWLVLDLCYEQLIYDDEPHNLVGTACSRMPEHTVIVGSASKSYAMTGWRCGWVLATPEVTAACNVIQSHSTSHPTSISQYAALEALTGPQECVETMRNEYRRRRDAVFGWVKADQRFSVTCPSGAFYLFPDVSQLLDLEGPRTSAELTQKILLEGHVALTAGEAFDAPGYVRLSYATSLEKLEEAWHRIQRTLR